MKTVRTSLTSLLLLGVTFFLPQIAAAQPIQIIHQFSGGVLERADDGFSPSGKLVLGSDGNYYGVTQEGGQNGAGTVFRMTPAGTVTTVHEFAGDGGRSAIAKTVMISARDGNLYGTVSWAYHQGMAFRLTLSGVFTVLHRFEDGFQSAYDPNSLIQGADGNFYGTTNGELSVGTGAGEVFKMKPDGTFTTIYRFDFPGEPQILTPTCLIQGTDGNFYGATRFGSATVSSGTIFKLTPSGTLTVLHNFRDGLVSNDGIYPVSLIQDPLGNFYGTTLQGGSTATGTPVPSYGEGAGYGTVFKMTPEGGVTILHHFGDGTGNLYGACAGGLVQAGDGNFYGATQGGGLPTGTIYRITPAGSYTVLHVFAEPNTTPGDLTLGADGALYGGAVAQAANAPANTVNGSAYRLTTQGSYTLLHRFGVALKHPLGVMVGRDGFLYGVNAGYFLGELNAGGALFRSTTGGQISILHTFGDGSPANDNQWLNSNLIQTGDGNLYGTSQDDGSGLGMVYKIAPTGTVTTVHQFSEAAEGNLLNPNSSLIQGENGNFYGTTGPSMSGPGPWGSVFQVTPKGVLTFLYKFGTGLSPEDLSSVKNGLAPKSGVIQASDGNFYGTTSEGGAFNLGTVFKLTPKGLLTVLHSFDSSNHSPFGGLVQAGDGNFYGATKTTLYRITPAGVLTHLYSAGDGTVAMGPFISPYSSLMLGADGNLYGANRGGTMGRGALFTMTLAGVVTVLHSFGDGSVAGLDGLDPSTNLSQDSHGAIFGTTYNDTQNGGGTIFVAAPLGAKISQTITFPAPLNPFLGSTVGLAAFASSNLPVSYTVTGPATTANGAVTLTGFGTVTVTATQSGNGLYSTAPPVVNSFRVTKAAQTINFSAVPGLPFGAKYTLEATASSDLPVSYAVVSGPAVLSGRQLTFTGVGQVKIRCTQAGNSTYAAAPEVALFLSVVKGPQTITFPGIAKQILPVAPITLAAKASSGLPITYTASGAAKVSGNMLTITGPGTVNVKALQAGDANVLPAAPVTIQFKVEKASQTVTFPAVGPVKVGQTVTLGATASSGLAMTYTASSGSVTISGNTVTFSMPGTVKLTATQPGNGSYGAASKVINVSVR